MCCHDDDELLERFYSQCLRNEIKIHSIFITCDPQMYVNLKHRTHYTGEDLNTWYIGVPLLVDRRLTHLAKLTQKILAIHLDIYTTDTFGKHCHHRSHLQSIVSFNVTTIGNRTNNVIYPKTASCCLATGIHHVIIHNELASLDTRSTRNIMESHQTIKSGHELTLK